MKAISDALGLVPLTEALGTRPAHCEIHGGYESVGTRHKATRKHRDIWTGCPGCKRQREDDERAVRQAEVAAAARARAEALMMQSAVPLRFVSKTLAGYQVTTDKQARVQRICQSYAENFSQHAVRGSSLILAGMKGTGKTHLAAGIINAIQPGHVGLYTTMLDLLRAVRDTWDKSSARKESQVLAELATVDLLVIDEVGLQYDTDAERTLFTDIVDRRYRNCKPMVLITNFGPKEFEAIVGERAHDRLREVARWVVFDWDSLRPSMRGEPAA